MAENKAAEPEAPKQDAPAEPKAKVSLAHPAPSQYKV